MNKKLTVILLLASLILAPIFANMTFAADATAPGPLQTVLKLFVDNLGFLFTKEFKDNLMQGKNEAVLYMSVLFAMLLILPLFYLFKMVFGEKNKGMAGILALVIGLVSIMVIPTSAILRLAITYGSVATVILYLLPVGAVYFIYQFIKKNVESKSKMAGYLLEFGSMVLGVAYTAQVNKYFKELAKDPAVGSVVSQLVNSQWLYFLGGVFVLFALFALYKLVTYGRSSTDIGRKIFGGERGGGIGGGAGGGRIPPTPAPPAGGGGPSLTDAERVLGIVASAESDFLGHVSNIKSLSDTELQQLSALATEIPKLADAIDALGTIGESYEKFAAAYSPEPQRTTTLTDLKNKFESKQTELRGYLEKVSGGLGAVRDAEKTKETEVNRIFDDATRAEDQIKMLDAEIQNGINQLDAAKVKNDQTISTTTDANAVRELTKANDFIKKATDDLKVLQYRLRGENSIKTRIDNSFKTSKIVLQNIMRFEAVINNEIARLNSAISLITQPFNPKNFQNSSSNVRSIGTDIPARQKETTDNKNLMDQLGAAVQEIQNTEIPNFDKDLKTGLDLLKQLHLYT
jgi:hypothetical protein